MNHDNMAFPMAVHMSNDPRIEQVGLTKREMFAAMAMQGMLANADGVNRVWKKAKELNHDSVVAGDVSMNCIAEAAVGQADALITELEKKK